MKQSIYSYAILLLFIAITSLSATAAFAEDAHPATILVQKTTDQIFSAITKNKEKIKTDSDLLNKLVNDIVFTHFDFKKMSGYVLGKYWRKASNDQKEKFTRQFRTLLIRTYANALVDNTGQKIKYLPARKGKKESQVTVLTEIEQKGSFPLPIHYRMYLKDSAWLVIDINIDGISLVTNYRSSFANEIRKADIDALIVQLTKRNQQTEKMKN